MSEREAESYEVEIVEISRAPTLEQLEAELGRENTNGGINAFFAAPSIRLWLLRL